MTDFIAWSLGLFAAGYGTGVMASVAKGTVLRRLPPPRKRHAPHLGCCRPLAAPTRPLRAAGRAYRELWRDIVHLCATGQLRAGR